MAFYPSNAEVPETLRTEEFLLRPLRASDVEADFEALVESRKNLRVWSQSDWPADDFTLDDNLADLEMHQDEHDVRNAFTFTVVDPASTACLGCVYIHGLKEILQALGAEPDALRDAGALDACVTFWVRSSRLEDGLDVRLLERMLQWFDTDWAFCRVAWGTTTADNHQQQLFADAGLVPTWRLPIENSLEHYVLYTAR